LKERYGFVVAVGGEKKFPVRAVHFIVFKDAIYSVFHIGLLASAAGICASIWILPGLMYQDTDSIDR